MKNQLIGKDPDAGKDWKQEDKGTTEDEMVGWHHRLKGHKFEKTWEIVKAGKPGMLQSMGSQRVGHSWGTEKEQIQNNRAWVPNEEIWIKSWKMEPESRSLASPWYFAGYVLSGKGTSLLKNWPMKLDRIPLKGMEQGSPVDHSIPARGPQNRCQLTLHDSEGPTFWVQVPNSNQFHGAWQHFGYQCFSGDYRWPESLIWGMG